MFDQRRLTDLAGTEEHADLVAGDNFPEGRFC